MNKNIDKRRLIVILGPTASGKSELAVKLAHWLGSKRSQKEFKINGAEIISADSRQVYKGMDIGTGKVPRDNAKSKIKNQNDYFYKGIKHYLLDVASPKRRFTVAQYQKLAQKAISKVQKQNKIPILCGGSGFYIQAVVDGILIPKVAPDWKLRKELEKKSPEELYQILKKLDQKRAKTIDKKNPRRLIRAIEIAEKIGHTPALEKNPLPYPVLIIGIKKTPAELKKLIKKRLLKRLETGMIDEVKKLKKSGLSWKRLEEFGLEYRWVARFLQGKISYQEMIEKLEKEIQGYAKRQTTWFKRDKRIKWIKNYREAKKKVNSVMQNP